MTTEPTPQTKERLAYTAIEVAEMLGVDAQTIYRLIKAEKLTAVSVGMGDRNYRITREAVDAYLAENTVVVTQVANDGETSPAIPQDTTTGGSK